MDESMRVCHLIPDLPFGGAEQMLVDIVTQIDDIEFVVGYFGDEDDLVPGLEAAGAEVRNFGESFRFDPRAFYRMTRFFQTTHIDVLHAHLPHAQILGRVGSVFGNVDAVISTKHNVPADNHPVTRPCARLTRWIDDVTVAVSNGVEHAFTGSSHRPNEIGDKWCTIYNGIDVDQFNEKVERADAGRLATELGIDRETPTILSVGRYVPVKQQDHAIEALGGRDDSAELILVGWGPREERLRSKARMERVDDRVHVTGRVPTVYPYYALADVFVLPSRREGLPITLLEAMAAGLPVIATDIPGTREAVSDGETGLLYPPQDVSKLSELLGLVHDRDRQNRYGSAGLDRVRDTFSVEQMASTYSRLYWKLQSGWRPRNSLPR